jgi:hypothetical protein
MARCNRNIRAVQSAMAASYPIPVNEYERNEAVRSYRIMESPPEIRFDEIGEIAGQICDCPISYISFIEGDRLWFKSRYGLPAWSAPCRSLDHSESPRV